MVLFSVVVTVSKAVLLPRVLYTFVSSTTCIGERGISVFFSIISLTMPVAIPSCLLKSALNVVSITSITAVNSVNLDLFSFPHCCLPSSETAAAINVTLVSSTRICAATASTFASNTAIASANFAIAASTAVLSAPPPPKSAVISFGIPGIAPRP